MPAWTLSKRYQVTVYDRELRPADTAAFRDHIKFGCAVTKVERTSHGVVVHDSHGHTNSYDHVVIAPHSITSIEMIEAVGEQFWPKYFSQLRDRLLPGGVLPTPEILKALGARFGVPVIREQIFGQDYARTLAI